MKKSFLILFLIAINLTSFGQALKFEKVALSDSVALANQMQQLAVSWPQQKSSEIDVFKLQIVSGNYKQAITTLEKRIQETPKNERIYLELYQQFAKAKLSSNDKETFRQLYKNYLINSDDIHVIDLDNTLIARDGTDYFIYDFDATYKKITSDSISIETAQNLINKYFLRAVYSSTRAIFFDEIKQDHKRRYNINDSIVIQMKDGAEISVLVVQRKGSSTAKNSALLISSIYEGTNDQHAILSAFNGYIGVVANYRGKRLSKAEAQTFD